MPTNLSSRFNRRGSGIRFLSCFLAVLAWCGASFGQGRALPTDAMVKVDGQTKSIIKGGLRFLASKQHLDGSWWEGQSGFPVAMTGYSLLAFMAAGNLPGEGEFSKNVTMGMQFLLDSIQPDGIFRNVSDGQYMYNHAIATIALAELYGESHSSVIEPKLKAAVSVILKAQNPQGGWRYSPKPQDADISVTVMQAVALRAVQDAGLAVPQSAIDRAIVYVKSCYVGPKNPNETAGGGFAYQPGGPPGFARTAAAIYSLQVLGKYDDPLIRAGSAFLFANLKEHDWWTYGNYYAAPAQYMIGGTTWSKWYARVSQVLKGFVKKKGNMYYWDTDIDGGNGIGPVFTTAVYIHMLAMPYHFLPIYQR
jgi:hypothetical protein